MNEEVLRVEEDGGVLTLRLNRPVKRNALNGALVEALSRALEEAEQLGNVRVIALRGEGSDFCAGADLAELERVTELGEAASLEDARRLGGLLRQMRRHPRPLVAANMRSAPNTTPPLSKHSDGGDHRRAGVPRLW